MSKNLLWVLFSFVGFQIVAQNAVDTYGKLSVSGAKMVGANGSQVQLKGMSLFWSQWEGEFYVANTVEQLKTDWCTNVVRCAMAIESQGYLTNPAAEEQKVRTVVEACIAKGMYVIIDWHDHNAHQHTAQAVEFFTRMSKDYGQYPNVLYEIFNEPLQVNWTNTIRPYCITVIDAIRKNDPDNIIICGTPNWSQDVDAASQNPITGKTNIMYTLHYYAGSHKQSLRNKASTAINAGLPIFVTEFGNVNADGAGAVDQTSSNEWFTFINQNKLSYCNWSLCDKNEGSAVLTPGTTPSQTFSTRLTTAGTFMYNHFKSSCPVYSSPNSSPTVSITSPSSNFSLCLGKGVLIKTNAADPDGSITKVEFYSGTNLIGTVNSSPFEFNYIPTVSGAINLTAKAYDDKNVSSTSAAVSLLVNALPNTPSVTSEIKYCLNSLASPLQANGQNLKWYPSETSTSFSSNAPVPTTNTAITSTYFVSQTTNACESNLAKITVVVISTSIPVVINTINYCQGNSATPLNASGSNLKWYTQVSGGSSSSAAPVPNTASLGTVSYYVTQTLNTCESPRAQIAVNVGEISAKPTVISSVEYCQNSIATALVANGSNLKWYTVAANGTSSSAIVPVTTTVGTKSYYVSQTVGACESLKEKIDVVIKASPLAPVVVESLNYTLDAIAPELLATGTGLKWYVNNTDNNPFSQTPIPNTSTLGTETYFVSQTINGCESPRSSIKISVINAFTVAKTPVSPIIDGVLDNVWTKVQGKQVSNLVQGAVTDAADLSGTFKTLWDDTYFYVLAEISDESKKNDSPDSYQDDAIEIFFDYSNNKPTTYNSNDAQYTFGFGDLTGVVNNNKTMTGVDFSILETNSGYIFEARFLWSALGGLGKVGDLHGFEFGINDDDNGADRDGKLIWNGTTDDAWQNPSLFGTLSLGDLISVCQKPNVPTLTVSKMEACGGETITVNSNLANSSNLIIQWMKNGNLISNETKNIILATSTGVYTVKYADTYLDNSACFAISNPVALTINPIPIKPIINGFPKACIYSPTEIYNYSTPDNANSKYQWTVENATILSGNGSSDIVLQFKKGVGSSAILDLIEINTKNCMSPKASLNIIFDCPNAVEEQESNNSFVYPNPFTSFLNVEGFSEYEICDLQGRLVKLGKIYEEGINTEELKAAVYLVKLSNTEFTKVFKLTKD